MEVVKRLLVGIECALRHVFCHDLELKLNKYEERLDYIADLIKYTNDIRKLPKAHGQLRLLQLSSFALCREVVSFFNRERIDYWIGSGTLIGAVRHGGFIPWDDDIDLCTTRDIYNKLGALLRQEFQSSDILVTQGDCIRIMKKGTPCQVDIFPWDEFEIDDISSTGIDDVRCFWNELYSRVVYDSSLMSTKHTLVASPSNEEIKRLADEYRSRFSGKHKMIIEGFEVAFHWFNCWPRDVIFPLAEIDFEGSKLKCPNNPEKVLSLQFGDYMNYPNSFHKHNDILSRIKGNENEMCSMVQKIGITPKEGLSL